MKKFSLIISVAVLISLFSSSRNAVFAQDQAEKENFERTWYDTCFTKKDDEKCYQQSKELVEKYPASQYADPAKKKVKIYELNKSYEKFGSSLKAFYDQQQDSTKLENLFSAGEEFLKIEPDQQSPFHLYVLGQMALAGTRPAMSQSYKNLDRVKIYAEQAIGAFDKATAAPEKYKKEYAELVDILRDPVKANLNQYLGFYMIESKGDQEQALAYLTQATQVKGKDNVGWKDPFNYLLRANIYSKQYEQIRAKYDALTDDEKTGDAGKELLNQVNQLLDTKLIPEYARVIATSNSPDTKAYKDQALEFFNPLWKFRTDAPDKAQAYIQSFASDPTIAAPPVPAKSADASSLSAPAAPVATTSAKLAGGTSAVAPGSKSTNGGSKGKASGSSKSKSKSGKRGRKG